MKKVLFATTALVASAGFASADVTLSGSAEMGIRGGDNLETQFIQDIDVTFTLSGTTDNGLTFGASIDIDESADQALDTPGTATRPNNAFDNDYGHGGVAVFISGDFGTVTLGDTDGALDWALTEAGNISNPGSLADDETSHEGYLGSYGDGAGDGQIVRYDNTFGDFGVAISYEQDASSTLVTNGTTGQVQSDSRDGSYALGFRYSTDWSGVDINLGLGYQSTDFTTTDQEIWGISANATFASGFSVGFQYSDWTDRGGVLGNDDDHIGIGAGYEFGPYAIHANYGEFGSGDSGYGLSASYDLGGGAGIRLGYGSSDNANEDFWSLGIAMSF
ncbi:porin [Rhodophyticola sp. CCM32]|uniref:porin n=1 Tax=Rhodophyticola sp. CCM32 TaxID=2916397 RepID=UPI00107F8E9D|nr:porin [Rhodophyticola sp. CCM32]QBY01838.1 porin [Rhodophyticola sp. CCM32]